MQTITLIITFGHNNLQMALALHPCGRPLRVKATSLSAGESARALDMGSNIIIPKIAKIQYLVNIDQQMLYVGGSIGNINAREPN